MADGAGQNARSEARSTVSTTTTHGPFTTVTTSQTSVGPQTTVTSSTPHSTTITHPTVTTTHHFAPPVVPVAPAASSNAAERRSSIRIRRLGADRGPQTVDEDAIQANRRRSSSEPQRPPLALLSAQDDLDIRRQLTATPLQPLPEEGGLTSTLDVPRSSRRPGMARNISTISVRGANQHAPEYTPQVVNMLDVIDPQVSTLTTLNNVQNSLFIPNLGWLYNRQPTYELSASTSDSSDEEIGMAYGYPEQEGRTEDETEGESGPERAGLTRTNTITSVLSGIGEGHNYAVLPHGASLAGWTPEEKAALNDHVRHLLHSRRAKFRRKMRGFGHYVRKPVGFLITLYATLITFWGAAWVLFLIGWISVGDRQAYFIEICDQILTALFCVVGIGLSPWRAVDTYHMAYVAFYAHRTWRIRKERGLPELKDHNELPSGRNDDDQDEPQEESVLTAEQQKKLEHHQEKLAKSHTAFRPHETATHHAFSVRLLIAVVTLLDCHSLFQMALGGTTWGIYYKDRPKALTAVILSCSISCNICAGILISIGDKRSRKKLVVEQMFRQNLTEEALKQLKKEKGLKAQGIVSHKKKKGKKREDEQEKPMNESAEDIQQESEK